MRSNSWEFKLPTNRKINVSVDLGYLEYLRIATENRLRKEPTQTRQPKVLKCKERKQTFRNQNKVRSSRIRVKDKE